MSVVRNTDGLQTVVALEDGNLVTGSVQDCTPYAERAKAMQNEGLHGSKEMRLAATLPDVIVERYMNANGIGLQECLSNPVHFRRMLNDPALAAFRVWPGKV